MATELGLAARLKKAHEEEDNGGAIARVLGDEFAKMPVDRFMWAALGSIGLSLALNQAGRKSDAIFIGQWVAPILAFALYKKMLPSLDKD